jgi:hypothetical protein
MASRRRHLPLAGQDLERHRGTGLRRHGDPRPLRRRREIVGLYYHNFASGTGLMAGGVFGRIAGRTGSGVMR